LNTVNAAKDYDFTSNTDRLKAVTGDLNLANSKSARETINMLDEDIVKIADVQAVYGALQNRFNQAQYTNTAYSNALNSGRSRIMDADFAQEASNLTKYNILQQAGTAMLRQANMTPQVALTLLQKQAEDGDRKCQFIFTLRGRQRCCPHGGGSPASC
jgi:flagellin